jgi:hypothetical protein
MIKTKFAILGIMAVLLLSLSMISADANFELTINGDGESSSNPVSGANGTTHDFSVTLNHSNSSLGEVTVQWSGASSLGVPSDSNITNGTHTYTTPNITMPSTTAASYRILTATFYNSTNISEELGSDTVNVYYSSTAPTPTPDPDESYCEDFSGEQGDLEITGFEIINRGEGDDEEWEYLDEIEIEVTIENTGDDNINDVMVEIRFEDDSGNVISERDMDLTDEDIDLGRINDDDEEVAVFVIDELPIDLEEGDYLIYVRAYEDGNEDEQCASTSDDFTNSDETYFEFEIIESDGATVIAKKDLEIVQGICGEKSVEVSFTVYNTGSDDEEKVLVILENSLLGIKERALIDNLRDGKGKEVTFFVTIPDEVSKSVNMLDIVTYYDYDDDEDELDEVLAYGENSEDEGDDFGIRLEVLACKGPEPTVAATLESETEIETELVVKAMIKNNGETNNFVISASDFDSWASLVSVTPQTASLTKGETQEVIVTLIPKESGAQSFKISTIVDGETYVQPISVNIKEKSGILKGISNTTLYLIIGISLLLILIFIILIVRTSRKSRKQEYQQ